MFVSFRKVIGIGNHASIKKILVICSYVRSCTPNVLSHMVMAYNVILLLTSPCEQCCSHQPWAIQPTQENISEGYLGS